MHHIELKCFFKRLIRILKGRFGSGYFKKSGSKSKWNQAYYICYRILTTKKKSGSGMIHGPEKIRTRNPGDKPCVQRVRLREGRVQGGTDHLEQNQHQCHVSLS